MKRNVEIDIELTPIEIEKELWEMLSGEQAALLVCMVGRYACNKANVSSQMCSVANHVKKLPPKLRSNITSMVENFLELLKEDTES